jgi:hypothetical protein
VKKGISTFERNFNTVAGEESFPINDTKNIIDKKYCREIIIIFFLPILEILIIYPRHYNIL